MAPLFYLLFGSFIAAVIADRFNPLVSRKNLTIRCIEKSIFIWLVSVILGAVFLTTIVLIFFPHEGNSHTFSFTLLSLYLAFGFMFSLPVPVLLFFFLRFGSSRIAGLWERVMFLLAVCYLFTFVVIAYFYSVGPTGSKADKEFAFIVFSYVAANTLAVIYSENRWK